MAFLWTNQSLRQYGFSWLIGLLLLLLGGNVAQAHQASAWPALACAASQSGHPAHVSAPDRCCDAGADSMASCTTVDCQHACQMMSTWLLPKVSSAVLIHFSAVKVHVFTPIADDIDAQPLEKPPRLRANLA